MRKFEYFSLALWLLLLFICTLVGMIAGPLGYDALSMAFSAAGSSSGAQDSTCLTTSAKP